MGDTGDESDEKSGAFFTSQSSLTPQGWRAAQYLYDGVENGFRGFLSVRLIPGKLVRGRRLASVAEPFIYVDELDGERIAVVVPPGFVSDFASMPWWARPFIAAVGRAAEAAVLHDWLYAVGDARDKGARQRADRLFRKALCRQRVNSVQRFIMFWSVRVAGKASFGHISQFDMRLPDNPTQKLHITDCEPYVHTVARAPFPQTPRPSSR